MFLYIFPAICLAEHRNDFLNEDMPGEDNINATPGSPIPSQESQTSRSASSSPSPLANKSHAPPKNSLSNWDMCKMVCLAGGTGLEQVVAAADDAMPRQVCPKQAPGMLRYSHKVCVQKDLVRGSGLGWGSGPK